MAEYAPEDKMLFVGIAIVLSIAAILYAAWTTTEQTPPDDLPRCPKGQVLVLDDPEHPVCR